MSTTSRAPTDGDDVEEGLLSGIQKAPSSSLRMKRMLKRMLPVTILIGVTVALISPSTHRNATLDIPEDVQHDWAQYSPYIPQEEYHLPPSGCKITQVCFVSCMYNSDRCTKRTQANIVSVWVAHRPSFISLVTSFRGMELDTQRLVQQSASWPLCPNYYLRTTTRTPDSSFWKRSPTI